MLLVNCATIIHGFQCLQTASDLVHLKASEIFRNCVKHAVLNYHKLIEITLIIRTPYDTDTEENAAFLLFV